MYTAVEAVKFRDGLDFFHLSFRLFLLPLPVFFSSFRFFLSSSLFCLSLITCITKLNNQLTLQNRKKRRYLAKHYIENLKWINKRYNYPGK